MIKRKWNKKLTFKVLPTRPVESIQFNLRLSLTLIRQYFLNSNHRPEFQPAFVYLLQAITAKNRTIFFTGK